VGVVVAADSNVLMDSAKKLLARQR